MRDRSRPEENPPGGNRLAIQDHFSQRPVSSEGRQAPRAYSRLSAALMKILALPDLDGRLITGAVVQKIREQLPDYWLRRAEEFEAAAPRPGDYHGNISTGEPPGAPHQCNAACCARLAGAHERCMNTAELCRFHASLLQ
jgi:hypothetical protein